MVRLLMFNALTSKWDNPAAEGQESFKNKNLKKNRENTIAAVLFSPLK